MIQLAMAMLIATAQSPAPAIERELTQFEQQLAATWKSGNCDAWGAMLTDDWSVIHITAAILTKAEALKMCRGPREAIEQHTVDDIKVRALGDTAIVTGRTTVSTGGTKPQTIRLRFTDVFIRRGGTWQVAASHATRITEVP